jgi:hypothetical protein
LILERLAADGEMGCIGAVPWTAVDRQRRAMEVDGADERGVRGVERVGDTDTTEAETGADQVL